MLYAHIYKLPRNAGFELIITTGPAICEGIVRTVHCTDKASAKAVARGYNAKAWNY